MEAGIGAAVGLAIEWGVKRGIYSNEAGLMAWLNIIAILIIQHPALRALRDYERQRKSGLDPQFDPQAIGVRGATFWERRRVEAAEVG